MSDDGDDPEVDFETYMNDVRTTVQAAVQAGYPENEVRGELDAILTELGDYEHNIEDQESLRAELDGLVRSAYLPGDEVAAVLAEKLEDVEGIGEHAEAFEADNIPEDAPNHDVIGNIDLNSEHDVEDA